MIGVAAARSEELLPLRVRLRGVGMIDEETERTDHQQGWQIHLSRQEICPKNRSHPSARITTVLHLVLWILIAGGCLGIRRLVLGPAIPEGWRWFWSGATGATHVAALNIERMRSNSA